MKLILKKSLFLLTIYLISSITFATELKTCSGNFPNGKIEFRGTYKDIVLNGQYKEWREGIWEFWYPNGVLKYRGVYHKGVITSKECWDEKGNKLKCELLKISHKDKYRLFKEVKRVSH